MRFDLGPITIDAPGVSERDIWAAVRLHERGDWGTGPTIRERLRNSLDRHHDHPVISRHVDRHGIDFVIETTEQGTIVFSRHRDVRWVSLKRK